MRTFQRLRNWWHKGETSDSLVYRQSISLFGLVPIAVCIVWFFGRSHLPDKFFAIILAIVASDCVLTSRRAVILTRTNFIYRPPPGELATIPLTSITAIKECRTVAGTNLVGSPAARGVRITTTSSAPGCIVVPLTVNDADAVFAKLVEVVAGNSPALARPNLENGKAT